MPSREVTLTRRQAAMVWALLSTDPRIHAPEAVLADPDHPLRPTYLRFAKAGHGGPQELEPRDVGIPAAAKYDELEGRRGAPEGADTPAPSRAAQIALDSGRDLPDTPPETATSRSRERELEAVRASLGLSEEQAEAEVLRETVAYATAHSRTVVAVPEGVAGVAARDTGERNADEQSYASIDEMKQVAAERAKHGHGVASGSF